MLIMRLCSFVTVLLLKQKRAGCVLPSIRDSCSLSAAAAADLFALCKGEKTKHTFAYNSVCCLLSHCSPVVCIPW